MIANIGRLRLTCGDSFIRVLVAASVMATTSGLWRPANAAQQEANVDKKADSQADDGAASKVATKMVAYHGHVVDKEGKPIAAAEVWYVLPTAISTPLGEIIGSGSIRKVAATDSDGNFSFSIEATNWKGLPFAVDSVRLTAKAPGYGCDWLPLAAFETNPIASERRDYIRSQTDQGLGEGRFVGRTFKLPREVGPVQGRLVDLEGRPLADVEICVESVQNVNVERLKKAFETSSPDAADQARRAIWSPGWLSSVDWQVLFPRPKTNANGEFTMPGLGRDQIATVTLYHDRVDAEQLHIVGTEMEPQRLARTRRMANGPKEVYFGTRFSHPVGPAIPVSGVVTELQSGKPVANAVVAVERLFRGGGGAGPGAQTQLRFARYIKATTDNQGRYKLVGIPPGKGHVLQVMPEITEPRFPLTQEFSMESTEAAATVNLQLHRGIWIEGKVTDAQTGELLQGIADYFPFRNNPNSSNLQNLGSITHRFAIDATGHYRVVGLPGRGVVMVRVFLGSKIYPKAAGVDKIEGYDAKTGRLESLMVGLPLQNWNKVSFVDPPLDATSYEFNIALSAGLTLNGRIVGNDDSQLSDIEALGLVPRENFFSKLNDATFTVTDYSSEHPRDLFFHAKNQSLVGYLHLEGKPPEELMVRLQPAVSVRGRLVDTETNEPASKFHLLCQSSKQGTFRTNRKETDNEGRFEVKGLLAGNVYKMDASNSQGFVSRKNGFTIDLTDAKPGDAIELGDVTGKNAKKRD